MLPPPIANNTCRAFDEEELRTMGTDADHWSDDLSLSLGVHTPARLARVRAHTTMLTEQTPINSDSIADCGLVDSHAPATSCFMPNAWRLISGWSQACLNRPGSTWSNYWATFLTMPVTLTKLRVWDASQRGQLSSTRSSRL